MSLNPQNAATVEAARKETLAARDALLATYAAVPEEKLTWSPGGPARDATWMVAHTGLANQAFSIMLRGEMPPMPEDPDEIGEAIRNTGKGMTSRSEAEGLVREHTDAVLSSLDEMTDERLDSTLQTPFGPMPMRFWLEVPYRHMYSHKAQLDYMQTIWGDLDEHVSPL